jgi:cell division initiation protein
MMDGTPDALREVQFRQALRGYHPDDVDTFVERASQVVSELQGELAEVRAALAAAEQHREEATEAEESLRRTLVLAQRTADLAIKEATEQGARLVDEALAERGALLARAEEEHRQMAVDAERDLREQLSLLAELRDRLQSDVDSLDGFVVEERERLRALLRDQLGRLDAALEPAPRPRLFDVELPDGESPRTGREGDVVAGAHVNGAADYPDAVPGDLVSPDDAFLAELRLAVTDEEPLGPRDHAVQDDDDDLDIFSEAGEGGRLGNRLRRRR